MSITQVNPTDKVTEEVVVSEFEVLSNLFGYKALQKTEFKRYTFKFDPWSIKSKTASVTTELSNINLTVARATDTAGTPSSFVVLSYKQIYHWDGSPSYNLYLSDKNGAHILQFEFVSNDATCGTSLDRVHTQDFDPQFFDTIIGGIFSISGTVWRSC